MAFGDIKDLINAVGLGNEKLIENSEEAKRILAEREAAQQERIKAQEKAGNADEVLVRAEHANVVERESKVAKVLTDMGANPDAGNEILTMLSTNFREKAILAQEKANKLSDDLNKKFLDDPIGYIGAQMRMESTIREADAAALARNQAHQSMVQIGQATQSVQVIANALTKTATDVKLAATLDKVAAAVSDKQAQLRGELAGVQIDGLQTLNGMTLQQINLHNTAFSAQSQERQEARANEHLKLAKASHAQQMKEWEQKLADRKANQDDLESMASYVKKGAESMGLKLHEVPTNKIIQMLNMKNPQYMDMLQAGMMSSTYGTNVVSENAGESARIVAAGAPLRPEQRAIKDYLTKTWQHAASPEGARTGMYDNTKKDQVTGAAAKFAVEGAKKMQADINPLDQSNIYAAPPLPSVAMLPAIQKSAWYRSTIQPLVESGALKEFSPEQLVGLSVEAIRAKKLSFNEAAEGLQAAHSAAAKINNNTKNYIGMGLPAQAGFKTRLSPTPSFSMPSVFDMTSPADVNRLLMSRMRADQTVFDRGSQYILK